MRRTVGVSTTIHFGDGYEWTGTAATRYYHFGGRRVAMRDSSGLSYIHGDHLTSATNATDPVGISASGPQYYLPYGATRDGSAQVATPYRFTGQREEVDLGLYDYRALV